MADNVSREFRLWICTLLIGLTGLTIILIIFAESPAHFMLFAGVIGGLLGAFQVILIVGLTDIFGLEMASHVLGVVVNSILLKSLPNKLAIYPLTFFQIPDGVDRFQQTHRSAPCWMVSR